MKKIFSRNKGFTLVECIIAVAVFGLLSLVVFMILTNASVRAAKASESEENLAQLIENVVGDETYKKFDPTDPSAKSLTLLIDNVNGGSGSGNMTVSYNVVSGYKNFIECPTCHHHANFTEFMSSTAGNPSAEPHMTPESPLTFSVASHFFVCPNCYATISFNLRCPDCSASDVYNKVSGTSYLFNYISSEKGGFECLQCGSTAVMAVDAAGNYVSEKVSADGFMVSGMIANGIRYGVPIDWSAHDTTELCKFYETSVADPTSPGAVHATDGGIQAGLRYTGSTNSSFAGTYELQLNVNSRPAEIGSTNPFFVELVFPIGYTVRYDETVYTTVSSRTKVIGTKTYPTLLISCMAGTAGPLFSGNGMKFTLTSNESGYSFEYDYNKLATETDNEQGLYRWFGFSLPTPTRTAEGYLLSANANGYAIAD